MGFFGIGVIRYSALLGQRILRRDLAYSAIATGLVVLLYLGMFVWLMLTYNLPEGIIVFLIPLVILSHSVTEEVRQVLERLIYDQRTRVLRTSLRDLSRLAVEQADLGHVLSRSLETICYPVLATYGVILIFDGERPVQQDPIAGMMVRSHSCARISRRMMPSTFTPAACQSPFSRPRCWSRFTPPWNKSAFFCWADRRMGFIIPERMCCSCKAL